MTNIPPLSIASIAQTAGAERRNSEAKTAEGVARDNATRSPFADRLRDVIENAPHESEVFADGGGEGGQGKFTADGEQPKDESGTTPKNADETKPNGGSIDLEA